MIATEYARWLNLPPQAEGESDDTFRSRIAVALRADNRLIEAHEVLQDKRWDEEGSDMVMAGVAGALAMALQGKDYGSTGVRQLGDEIAAGVVATAPAKQRTRAAEIMIMLALAEASRE